MEYEPNIQDIEIRSFEGLVEWIRQYPGFLLSTDSADRNPQHSPGGPALVAMQNLVAGIGFAEQMHQVPWDQRINDSVYNEFEISIQARFPRWSGMSSFNLAFVEAITDEAAFDLWFAWWDEFQRERRATAPNSPESSSPPGQEGTGEVDRPSAPPPTS